MQNKLLNIDVQNVVLIIIGFVLVTSVRSQAGVTTFENALNKLPGIHFEKVTEKDPSVQVYELKIRQPLDHNDTLKGFFEQKVIVRHRGFDNPTLMSTQGYGLYRESNELEKIYDANHINVEHRFYGASVPSEKPWQYLTVEQAVADLHAIRQLFKKVYNNTWISTGISKGGQLTLFYRYFYPEDVDVSIPYVTPINNGLKDERIYKFLDTIGTKECRNKIKDFQLFLLKNKAPILERLRWYSMGAQLTYDYLGSLDLAYEYAVLEYSFSFWQSGFTCNTIPVYDNLERVTEHFLAVSNIGFYSDKTMEKFAPHYYQSATQLGYYGYDVKPFKEYLDYFEDDPSAVFVPKKLKNIVFSNELNKKLLKWLSKEGSNIIYIYGGSDTWSANMVIPSGKVNAKSFVIPNEDHYGARVKNMSPEMKLKFAALMEEWTGLKADLSKL
ncbi:PS-10 peptidase S37 [Zhouia amylolytica]|uniref:PS-10 peptidase S37 n=1 Tax=Zhouia amylolytica TaxID=376730 RepID=A0A1I6S6P5_9FLAO|nr:S28 family serine protease [Zhouia amylolytica]SFS72611.1 PS-10 peptidase S37 [Zhouia amylolytica]